MKSSVVVGGEKAERQRGKEGEKVESCHRQVLPKLAAFFLIFFFFFPVHLAQRICGVNYVEPPREESASFTAQLGNVNKQAGVGGGRRRRRMLPRASA